ncbi:hypothetical protein [Deinococcus sp.]|uniref:hypothetical protein n=1 Tax=Deinococcus sp. TaxID=47478 RepID=UPI0025FAF7C9|nr:hypothetical protein [Deinococcus sp.]
MNRFFLFALVAAVIMAALNVAFSAGQYGLSALPGWFYLAQMFLIPAFILNVQLFPRANSAPQFAVRAGLYALGWALPFSVYKLSQDLLSPAFSLGASLISLVVTCALFGVLMAYLRRR